MFWVAPVTRFTTSKSPSGMVAPEGELGVDGVGVDGLAAAAGVTVAGGLAGTAVAAVEGAAVASADAVRAARAVSSTGVAVGSSTSTVGAVTGEVVASGCWFDELAVSGWRSTGGMANGGVVGTGPTATRELSEVEHDVARSTATTTTAHRLDKYRTRTP